MTTIEDVVNEDGSVTRTETTVTEFTADDYQNLIESTQQLVDSKQEDMDNAQSQLEKMQTQVLKVKQIKNIIN